MRPYPIYHAASGTTSSSLTTTHVPKTSLKFILEPTASSPTFPTSDLRQQSTTSTTTTTSFDGINQRNPPGQSRLEALPKDVLGRIAYHLVIECDNNDTKTRIAPSSLIAFLRTCRKINQAISFDSCPELYHRLYRATFDHQAIRRRYQWLIPDPGDLGVNVSGGRELNGSQNQSSNVYDVFDGPKSWAVDYKTRWEMAKRMRAVVRADTVDVPGVCDRDQLLADMWNVWFLLTENDRFNLRFLTRECLLQDWIVVYYRDDLLRDSLVPGYPRITDVKSLGLWCGLLAGSDVAAERTPAQVDEKIFILRPYVFACAKYDATYAPWQHRRLPLDQSTIMQQGEASPAHRSRAITYKRFGHSWERSPPHFLLGAYLTFFRLLERQPGRMGLKPGSSMFRHPSSSPLVPPGLFSRCHLLSSIDFDREWQRSVVCSDIHRSPGLPPLALKGEIGGFWRGTFLFYDFESYRKILAGNMRGVYTGTFAEQAAEIEIVETVIKIPKSQVGGDGPILNAGFSGNPESDLDDEEDLRRIRAGNGYEVVIGDGDVGHETEMDDDAGGEGWTREILLTGRCRTSWGWAKVRGRVRAWDGLVILVITYSRHAMGKWLWRGYLHSGGYILGRWRDTYTGESMRGYEGPFGMVRAGDKAYPSQLPTRMEDSLGVATFGVGAESDLQSSSTISSNHQSLRSDRSVDRHHHNAQKQQPKEDSTRTTIISLREDRSETRDPRSNASNGSTPTSSTSTSSSVFSSLGTSLSRAMSEVGTGIGSGSGSGSGSGGFGSNANGYEEPVFKKAKGEFRR